MRLLSASTITTSPSFTFVAHGDDFRTTGRLRHVLRLDLQGLGNPCERQNVDLAADTQAHAIDDGKCQRQAKHAERALPARRTNFDPATERTNVITHDIETDPPAGDVTHRFGRRESRHENELVDLRWIDRPIPSDQPALT